MVQQRGVTGQLWHWQIGAWCFIPTSIQQLAWTELGWALRLLHSAKYCTLRGKYTSRSGKCKANSEPGLKQMWWNALLPEHETWRKSMWKGKKVFFLPSCFGRMRPSNGFSLTFPVRVCFFHEDSRKREVCGGNRPVNLYITWGEFHPFLYPAYFHRYQTEQFEHSYFKFPYSSSWTLVLYLKRCVAKTSTTSPLSEVRPNTMSQAHHECTVHTKHHLPLGNTTGLPKRFLTLFCLHKGSFSATPCRQHPNNCGLQLPSQQVLASPFSLLSTLT